MNQPRFLAYPFFERDQYGLVIVHVGTLFDVSIEDTRDDEFLPERKFCHTHCLLPSMRDQQCPIVAGMAFIR